LAPSRPLRAECSLMFDCIPRPRRPAEGSVTMARKSVRPIIPLRRPTRGARQSKRVGVAGEKCGRRFLDGEPTADSTCLKVVAGRRRRCVARS
jgi:hypothetical protein